MRGLRPKFGSDAFTLEVLVSFIHDELTFGDGKGEFTLEQLGAADRHPFANGPRPSDPRC